MADLGNIWLSFVRGCGSKEGDIENVAMVFVPTREEEGEGDVMDAVDGEKGEMAVCGVAAVEYERGEDETEDIEFSIDEVDEYADDSNSPSADATRSG